MPWIAWAYCLMAALWAYFFNHDTLAAWLFQLSALPPAYVLWKGLPLC